MRIAASLVAVVLVTCGPGAVATASTSSPTTSPITSPLTSPVTSPVRTPRLSPVAGPVVTLPTVSDLDLVVGEVLRLPVDVNASEVATLRFQTRSDPASAWADALVEPLPTGWSRHEFTVPTAVARDVGVRVLIDAGASSTEGYTSPGWSFRVTAAPVGPQPSRVRVTPPPAEQHALGSPVSVTGSASGGAGRPVRLELSTARGWLTLARATTDGRGDFVLALPTDWYRRGTLRVSVPASSNHLAGTSATFTDAVVPTYVPQGAATDFRPMVQGTRWDPCAGTLTYKVNRSGVPARRVTELKRAFRELHRATGLVLRHAGSTTAVPYRTDGGRRTASDADFTVAFTDARRVGGLAGNVAGLGGFSYRSGGEIVQGLVSLDKQTRLRDGFGNGSTWGTLMLHEIGHAAGLGHASGAVQAMYPSINRRSRGSYQAGDLAGLGRLGTGAGCVSVPSARTGGGPLHTVVAR